MAEVEVCRFDEHSGECRWIACPNLVPGSPTGCPLPWPREQIDRLRSVALAARALVQSANNRLAADEVSVDEPALTALESALEAAGYGMSEEEFEQGVADETDDDGCSACGHGLRYHFDDGAGNVFCRYTPDCECRHADGVTR